MARRQGDEFYLGLLDELAELHVEKSSTYGSSDDALANFAAVAEFADAEEWWYPLERVVEKLARVKSLREQGRIDEIGQELPDIASLTLCAEALRRRWVVSAGPRLVLPSRPLPAEARARGADDNGASAPPPPELFRERLRELMTSALAAIDRAERRERVIW